VPVITYHRACTDYRHRGTVRMWRVVHGMMERNTLASRLTRAGFTSVALALAFGNWIPASAIERNRRIHNCQPARMDEYQLLTRLMCAISWESSFDHFSMQSNYILGLPPSSLLPFHISFSALEGSWLIIDNPNVLNNIFQALHEFQMRWVLL
jgi:hypothetical protein